MNAWYSLGKNRYFEVLGPLNSENRTDCKVAMLSELDLTGVQGVRSANRHPDGLKPSYTAFVAAAVAKALREQPHANRIPFHWLLWKRIVQLREIHVSIAVERDRPGLEQAVFVGTIRDTERKSLLAITEELRGLAHATPENCPRWRTFSRIVEHLPCWLARILISVPNWFPNLWIEHRGGAAMISSPAKYGVDVMIGAWPWPLGFSFGYVKDRPLVVRGELAVRPTMTLTMSFDRRLMGGAPAARFFNRVVEILEHADAELVSQEPRGLAAVSVAKGPSRHDLVPEPTASAPAMNGGQPRKT